MQSGLFVAFAVLLASLVPLAGCAAQPIVFDPSANAAVKKIGVVVRVREPLEYRVVDVGCSGDRVVGVVFGVAGLAVEGAAMQDERSLAFTAKMADQQPLGPDERLTRGIVETLRRRGYDTVALNAGTQPDAKLDAILTVTVPGIGYACTSKDGLEPWVGGTAELVSTATNAKLYSQRFSSASQASSQGATLWPALPAYTFPTYDTLQAFPKLAREGLGKRIDSLAAFLGRQLSKGIIVDVDAAPSEEPAGAPPGIAAGFSLGKGVAAAEARCTEAHLKWSRLDDDHFSCSGTPAGISVPATVTLGACAGTICEVVVNASADGAGWKDSGEALRRARRASWRGATAPRRGATARRSRTAPASSTSASPPAARARAPCGRGHAGRASRSRWTAGPPAALPRSASCTALPRSPGRSREAFAAASDWNAEVEGGASVFTRPCARFHCRCNRG